MEQVSFSNLHLPAGINYECTCCGRSCGMFLEIPVDPEFVEPVRAIPAERLAGIQNPQNPILEKSPLATAGPVMRMDNGHCCLQRADGLCAIHAACGYDAKPPICRDFPFKYIQTPAGTFVGLSFVCTAVLANAGPSVESRRAELESAQISQFSRRTVHDPAALTEDIPLSWAQYEAVEADLDGLLDPDVWHGRLARDPNHGRDARATSGHVGQRLVMQAVYLRLLINFLRQARMSAGAAVAGPEANAEALDIFHRRMREGGDLLEAIRRTSQRGRPSPFLRRSILGFAHALRTSWARRGGRIASYFQATGQYLLFAAGRGRYSLPDGAEVNYTDLRGVGFDPARPEFDELLTRYFRHRLFRKDLAAADTIQTAHHMQLLHWGLIHWHAAALAAAERAQGGMGGSPMIHITGETPVPQMEIEARHLGDAIAAIENQYVFHTSLEPVFSAYPKLRGFMDRLFQNPHYAFVMGWGEWTN